MSFIKKIFNIFSKPDLEKPSIGLTTTENGAISLQSSGNDLLNLFVATVRGLDDERLGELMEKSAKESMFYTLKIVAYVRDIRGGKGERDLGRKMMEWLLEHDERQLYANMKAYISEYGRWDDGVYLQKSIARKHYIELLASQLRDDIVNMVNMKSVSLAAKWVPSESSVLNKKTGISPKIWVFPPRFYAKRILRLSENTLTYWSAKCAPKNGTWLIMRMCLL